jgi:hypothetical protein
MNKRALCMFLATALLLACAPAFAAEPIPPRAACSNDLTGTPAWQPRMICPESFCNDDWYCTEACPSNPDSYCNLFTYTCVYPGSGGPGSGGGSCPSGGVCAPGRFCNSNSDCTSCTGGCSGYCAGDGICRVL